MLPLPLAHRPGRPFGDVPPVFGRALPPAAPRVSFPAIQPANRDVPLGLPFDQSGNHHIYSGYSPADLTVFDAFEAYTGAGTPGFLTDFLGNRTRTDFVDVFAPLDGKIFPYPIPGDFHAETIEWLGLLKSVLTAPGSYRAMEVGAGWAPWLVAGATAARQRGITDLRLHGFEPHPGRLAFMRQHFADNGLDPDGHRLQQAAICPTDGVVEWANVGRPEHHYGLRPLGPDGTLYTGEHFARTLPIPAIAFRGALLREQAWDLVHVDVQGGETDLCRSALAILNQRVRWLVVGTHSRKIDGDLMEMMFLAGWALEHEKPARYQFDPAKPTLEGMGKVDGTQVWRNPRLVERASA